MKRNLRACLTSITLLSALALPLHLAAQNSDNHPRQAHYSVIDLGTLGGTFSYAGAINNQGWAVGAATLTGDTAQHAVLWRKGSKINIGTFGGPNSAVFGKGLNERGQMVGEAETSTPDPLGQDFCGFGTRLICLPFIWQNGVMTQLPTVGGYNGNTYDINNRGQVAGQAQNGTLDPTCSASSPGQETPPVLWENAEVEQLPTLAGDIDGVAIEINDHGEAVGSSGNCTNFGTGNAVLWPDGPNGGVIDLGNFGGSMNNSAFDINNQGQVVGQSDLPGDTTGHGFIWSKEGGMKDLGTLSGDAASSAAGINEKGQVVGASCVTTEGECRAFLWQDGVMTDLNTLVPPDSPVLFQAFDINSRGQIVGIAQTSNGEFHAYVATPCDENRPGIEGCDYSTVDATAATRISPAPSVQTPAVLTPGNHTPVGMWNRFRFPWRHRSLGSGTGPALDQKQESAANAVTNDWIVDRTLGSFCWPGHCRYYGYCEVQLVNGQLQTDGACTSHKFGGFCYIQPSSNCPSGKPPLQPSFTSCGGLGSDRIDLGRACSFF